MIKRRIELVAFETDRLSRSPQATLCPVCRTQSELLTARQAATLIQVRAESIRRWVIQGKAHGLLTPGGGLRVCRNSLLVTVVPPEGTRL
ncbi:MAG TPA: hypothetical protein VE961_21415 [Pyrinomonadaceae bacterium]|nr:hypothetical protein [Pyrinomonadaceae bacterium]